MTVISTSRGTQLDIEKCVKNVGGNRFNLVLAAALRSKEIKLEHKKAGHTTHINSPISALLEIQEGKLSDEYVRLVGMKQD